MPADDYDDPSDIDEIREYLSDADEYDGDPPGYEEPTLDQTWDCVITVDNLPKVPKAKEAKLKKQETDQRFADWATGANVEATVGLDETLSKQSGGLGKLSQAAPKPPAQKRTGGGFVRKK